ncbi:MAG: hypothetical protein U1E23_18895 [Reyranellaceae bacterium]
MEAALSTSTPCSTCTSSDVYSTKVKSSASSGTGARPVSMPGAVPGCVAAYDPSMPVCDADGVRLPA